MKTFSIWPHFIIGLLLCGLPALAAGASAEVRTESAVITALHISDTGLNASFTGRWISEAPSLVLADVDHNGFIVLRDPETPPKTWQCLCKTLQDALDQHIPVSILFSTWGGSRGGIIIFSVPSCQIKIVHSKPPQA